MSNKRRLFGFTTAEEALEAVKSEVNNWSWLDRTEKDTIIEGAKIIKDQNRFGPIFSVEFKAA